MLLDKIFKVNEKERITIEGIEADPWYQGPLQPKFAQAEARINQQQREVEERCRQRALNPVSATVLGSCPCAILSTIYSQRHHVTHVTRSQIQDSFP